MDKMKVDVNTILADIYDITGLKVDPDDPIVTAALVQSKVFHEVADQVVNRIQKDIEAIYEALKILEEKGTEFQNICNRLDISKEYLVAEITLRSQQKIMEDLEKQKNEVNISEILSQDKAEIKKILYISLGGLIAIQSITIFALAFI